MNEKEFIEIAKTSQSQPERINAIMKITNESALIEIFQIEKDSLARRFAFERIKNKSIASKIMKKMILIEGICSVKGHDYTTNSVGHECSSHTCKRCGYSALHYDDGRIEVYDEGKKIYEE